MRKAQSNQVWTKTDHRPGFFGSRKKEKIAALNAQYGEGNWSLRWYTEMLPGGCDFEDACIVYYEYAYYMWMKDHPEEVDRICSFSEVIDNATTNIKSGIDYKIQEARATHIQDIAIRNALELLDRKFTVVEDPMENLLVVRTTDDNGWMYGPGHIPFYNPALIIQPSLRPGWANPGTVEDFWQSNKFIYVKG